VRKVQYKLHAYREAPKADVEAVLQNGPSNKP
jgi:hypothetical protein